MHEALEGKSEVGLGQTLLRQQTAGGTGKSGYQRKKKTSECMGGI